MLDSVEHANIPLDTKRIAVYDDGTIYGPQNVEAWPADVVAEFASRGATIDHITVNGQTLTAKWGDCEWGDLDEAGIAAWRAKQAAAGLPQGGAYASLSRLGNVVAICGRIPLWAAHYTGVAHICSEACRKDAPNLPADFPWDLIVGTQYIDHGPNGENIDISLCSPGWPQ